MKRLILEVSARCRQEQRGVLACWSRNAVMACWRWEHASTFLGARDLLAALFLLDAVGLVQGPRALGPGRLLEVEAAEVPPELRCPHRAEGDAARGTAQGSPLRH